MKTEPLKSKLAAIMFTDIAGYSGMMEEDEEKTIAIIKEHNNLIFPLVDSYNGKIIDAIGDGLLIIFESAVSSCRCALAIQKAINSFNMQKDENGRFYIRVGIHLGDIRIEEERIFGTGVNIASRIEPFSLPGGICISEDIYKQLTGKVENDVTDLGYKELKNIKQKVKIYHLKTGNEQEQLSEIKETLIKTRDKLRTEKPDENRFEDKLERKINGFVERILDKAIVDWNDKPDIKKEIIGETFSKDISEAVKEKKQQSLEKVKKITLQIDSDDDDEKKKKKKLYAEDFISGSLFTIGFIFVYLKFDIWWMLILALFSTIPIIKGIIRLIKSRRSRKLSEAQKSKNIETRLFKILQELGGRSTVIQMSSKLELSLDETQSYLETYVKRGYINQEIDPNGVLYYEIPQLSEK